MLQRFRAWSQGLTQRQRYIGGGVALLAVATLGTWLLWPSGDGEPPPRERQYRSTTACLLTDERDLTADPARTAWAGMQEASVQTLVKVQHLAITGPQTAANGATYYNTLGVQQCTVIIAAGDIPVAAMVEGLAAFPDVKHYAVGGDTKGKSITAVDTTSANTIKTSMRDAVTAAG